MAWDDILQRELTPDEEEALRAAHPTSLPDAILAEEARTGQRSVLRNQVVQPHVLPEINITDETHKEMDNEPDVIAVEDKPAGSSLPAEPPKGPPQQKTAADVMDILNGVTRKEPVNDQPSKTSAADELAALLQPDVRQINSGAKPIWPPTPVPTGAETATLPPDQRPKTVLEAIQRAQGVDPGQLRKQRSDAMEPARQATQGVVGSAVSAPWKAIAGVEALSTLAGLDNTDAVHYAIGKANHAEDVARILTGADPDPTGFNKIANVIGSSYSPAGAATLPLTAGVSAVNLAAPYLTTAAEAAPKAGVTHTIESVGGPAQIKDSQMKTLGGIAAVTLGAIFAPSLYSKFKTASLPRLRPVENAAPGTVAMSDNVDLARTYDDANAGIIRLAKKAGLNQQAVKQLSDTFQMQTRATAQTIANSAVQNGRAEVPNFTFSVPTPLAKLNQTMTQPAADYLHTRDTLDELFLAKQKPGNTAGPPKIRGMTEQDALRQIWALEQSNPGVIRVAQAYQQNLKALRKFESTGEFATMSKKNLRFMNASRSNEVPWSGPGTERVTEEAVNRLNPIEGLSTDMVYRMRARMENEAKGQYIDYVKAVQPDMFKQVTSAQLKDNPHWKDNTVKIYRRGKPEYYTTDPFIADVMRMDPYFYSSAAAQVGYSLKRGFEMTTTGAWAPWFAITSASRNWLISKHTAPAGTRSPTLLGTAYAVPQQLIPQLANKISDTLDKASNGWLGNVLGKPALNATSQWMADAYQNSLYARIQSLGTHKNSLMEQQTQAQSTLSKAVQNAKGTSGSLLRGYGELLSAIHNAPSFAFISKNSNPSIMERVRGVSHTLPMPMTELAMEARNLTGDPHIGGRYMTSEGDPIRMEGRNPVSTYLTQKYGAVSEIGRDVVPWFNQTQQGAKRLGKAYLDNPAKFVSRFWLYSMMPAATGYLYARSLGSDPNGTNYVDYMMNRRSEYAKTMYYYIPVPGRPAEEGIEWPRFHEGSILARQMEAALDHLTRSNLFTEGEDFRNAASSWLDVAVVPPMPPVANTLFATQGMVGPQGVFGGEAYMRKSDPFDQTAGMPSNLELLVRSLVPGIGEIAGSGWAAMTQTPNGVVKAAKNAAEEMGKRAIIKTPGLRDIVNLHTPISGNTNVSSELFKKQKAIDQLIRFFQKYGEAGQHQINTKPVSKTGNVVANKALGPNIPPSQPGLDQPPPTNPLYDQFVSALYLKFHKDSEKTGGIGFKSLWDRYRDLSDALVGMRNINMGNMVTWHQQMEQRPDLLQFLKENNIDSNDAYAVRNFYERKRQDAARVILFQIRDVENQFSQQLGQPVKLEDLQPYGNPAQTQSAAPQTFDPYGAAGAVP